MIGATKDEMMRSFTGMNLQYDDYRVWFPDPDATRIRINLGVKAPHQLIYLARLFAQMRYEPRDLYAGHLWIRAWEIWNRLDEAVSFKTFEQFRRSYGENRSVESAPGTYFRHDEFVEAVCCLLQPMLIGWDAYYVPVWAYGSLDYIVFVSHDGFVEIEVRTREMHDRAKEIFERHDWIKPLLK